MTEHGTSCAVGQASIAHDIWDERRRQDEQWGPHRHSWPEWMGVLLEEIGEAAMVANKLYWSGRGDDRLMDLRRELIQSAAVIVAIVEHIDELTDPQP